MSVKDLTPLITGGSGALVVMLLGYILILTGKFVTGNEHERALKQIDQLQIANDKMSNALQTEREQKMQLMQSGQLTNQLVAGLLSVSAERRGEVLTLPPAVASGTGGNEK